MNTKLVITDLTRMYGGRICIAGYSGKRRCVRPVLPPPGIPESLLFKDRRPVVYPFALVQFNLLSPVPDPPHTEDQLFDPGSLIYERDVHSREEVLEWSLFESVADLFEQEVLSEPGYYVMACQGPRSLGTIQPIQISQASYGLDVEGAWDYRLKFCDHKGAEYRLKITDLSWQYYCRSMRGPKRQPKQIAAELTKTLQSRKVYLRLGLARGWAKFPDRCYIQITGVYTFPDYLEGKTFADFSPAVI